MAGEATAGNGASADIRESILSELSAGPKDDAPVEAPPVEEAPTDDEPTEAAPDDADLEAAPDEEAPPDEDEPAEDEPDLAADADPKVKAGLDQIRRAEKHARAKLEADRQALEAAREQHRAAISELETFKSLAKRAKYDPTAVLRALGLTEDDFELVGHAIYSESKAAAADPNRKAAAAARLKEREKEDALTATQKRLEQLEQKMEAERQEAALRAETAQYVAGVKQHVAKTARVAQAMKADAEMATAGLQFAFDRLVASGNKSPTPAQVVAEYDKRLAKLTGAPAPAAKVAAKPGAKPVVAGKPAANTNGAPVKKTEEEIRAEILADISTLS